MTGKVLYIEDAIVQDQLACRISEYFIDWSARRQPKVQDWEETQRYIFATDTTKTSNSKLPWSNKTTIPKLSQIRDNLFANYMATMFPKRKWMIWEAFSQEDQDKASSIEQYIGWCIDRNEFYDEAAKLVLDYIDYGNCFGTVEWIDLRQAAPGPADSPKAKVGYVGPIIRRISPLDIVFNPAAESFSRSPKIVKSLISFGELKEMLEREAMDEHEKEDAQILYTYLKDYRQHVSDYAGDVASKDALYQIAGFDSFQAYLESNYCEILTFYGDIYDHEKDEFLRNQVIKIVDRHKIISKRTHPAFFGTAPIYHAGWRLRPDNLWAMGPLDNLVGMQYRIDHLENIKADCFDLIAFPPLKVKGYVDDFVWQPMERIYIGDDSDVEMVAPDVAALQADTQIAILEQKMEEMAGSPKEAMGFRTPGEKTAYEVQRLENAAARIFQNKIAQFERQIIENLLNAMLELAKRNMGPLTIKAFNDEFKMSVFKDLSPDDITGMGRIRPVAARHFAEQAEIVQNLNNFFSSPAYQAVALHISSEAVASLWEDLLNLEDYNIVQPYIALTEQAQAQRIQNSSQEQAMMDTMTPGGVFPGDHDIDTPDEETAPGPEATEPLV